MIKCLMCDIEFKPKNKSSRFCSTSCSMRHPETIAKRKKSSILKYGTDNWNNPEKRLQTTKNRYGVRSGFSFPGAKEKSKNTLLERYGVEHNSTIRKKNFTREELIKLYDVDKLTCIEIGEELGVKRTCIERYMHINDIPLDKNGSQSSYERKIHIILDELGISYICNTRKIIPPKELDVYIEDHKLAIEINGMFWHSDTNIDKNNHVNKYNMCKEVGIHLIQIYDYEIDNRFDIVKSIILSSLNKNFRFGARKCDIYYPITKEVKHFLDENHIQGYVRSPISIGLKYNDELVSLMTFGRPRFNKSYDLELFRLVSKCGVSVTGGAEKIFTEFQRKYDDKSLISYCDRRFFTGHIYDKLGFTHVNESGPSYVYNKGDVVLSRYMCQKHKLKNFLSKYNDELTEVENMNANGFHRVWDAGCGVFVK
jgi:DNA-directed RNA polymerase subunit N (RpoN/RPB10)